MVVIKGVVVAGLGFGEVDVARMLIKSCSLRSSKLWSNDESGSSASFPGPYTFRSFPVPAPETLLIGLK